MAIESADLAALLGSMPVDLADSNTAADGSDVKALIFDCDGTLVDSMPLHFVSWTQVAKEAGLSFPVERFYQLGGVPTRETLEILAREQGKEVDIDAASARKASLHTELEKEATLQEISCVADIARAAHGVLPIAVATGGSRPHASGALRGAGLSELFEVVVTCEDVDNGKPAPDTYLQAAARLGVDPKSCWAWEDTDIGLTAARAAGMAVIDVRKVEGYPLPPSLKAKSAGEGVDSGADSAASVEER
eukprot:PLAT172.17.p1 GENE.PLAT172.17~~PLAT172.17.p1  ORF type:complete len:248 (-),score=72.57 PLAT172.17:114-857(-)